MVEPRGVSAGVSGMTPLSICRPVAEVNNKLDVAQCAGGEGYPGRAGRETTAGSPAHFGRRKQCLLPWYAHVAVAASLCSPPSHCSLPFHLQSRCLSGLELQSQYGQRYIYIWYALLTSASVISRNASALVESTRSGTS